VALSEVLLEEPEELPLDAALLEALPEALPLLPEPDPPPQAEITDAPATLTPMALPRRMNLSREIFSFKTLPSFAGHQSIVQPYGTQFYTRATGL